MIDIDAFWKDVLAQDREKLAYFVKTRVFAGTAQTKILQLMNTSARTAITRRLGWKS